MHFWHHYATQKLKRVEQRHKNWIQLTFIVFPVGCDSLYFSCSCFISFLTFFLLKSEVLLCVIYITIKQCLPLWYERRCSLSVYRTLFTSHHWLICTYIDLWSCWFAYSIILGQIFILFVSLINKERLSFLDYIFKRHEFLIQILPKIDKIEIYFVFVNIRWGCLSQHS